MVSYDTYYNDFIYLILKYLNIIPICSIFFMCQAILLQNLICDLLPCSKIITFTDYINSCTLFDNIGYPWSFKKPDQVLYVYPILAFKL